MYRYIFLILLIVVGCAETPKTDFAEKALAELRAYCAKAPKDLHRITERAVQARPTPLIYNLHRRAEAYKILQNYRGVPLRFESLMTTPIRTTIDSYEDAKRFLYLYQSAGISEAGCSSPRASLLWRMLLIPVGKANGWKDQQTLRRERVLSLKKWKSYSQGILKGYVEAALIESLFRDLELLENVQLVTLSPSLVKIRAHYLKKFGVRSRAFLETQKAFPSGDCTNVTPKNCNKKKFVTWARKRKKYEIQLTRYLTSIKKKVSLEILKL